MPGKGASGASGWRAGSSASTSVCILRLRVERERGAVGRLNDSLDRTLRPHVPERALRALQVALDELLTNVIMHAREASGPIEIEILRSRDAVETTISYVAAEFDPTVSQGGKRSASIADARIGGLGIELVRALMDEFRYARDAGRNVVMLAKKC